MRTIFEYLQVAFALFGGYLGWLLGGVDGFLYALIFIVVADYLTGVLLAIQCRCLSSQIGFQGLAKKMLIFLLVAMANIIDAKILGSGSALKTAVIFFYASNEGISILENAARLGLPIPAKLRTVLAELKKEER